MIILYASICLLALSCGLVGHDLRARNFLSASIFAVAAISAAASIVGLAVKSAGI
jgi:hypothetical protein